ncbi:MAG: macro domain-containing protein [Lachnospiraceae bacterium]|nr:macro domain-containing protein [Lachnospiraceae bacterium]
MAFKIIRNDITKVVADAIVNTANPDPIYASGTDGAIYEAAGADELLAERRKIGEMRIGQAGYTPAFNLAAKYIIHTVGPAWDGGNCGELDSLRQCYENSLKLADELKCRSIAFPLISTGVYGFPKDKALQTAISVFSEFLSDHEMEIILVVFDKKSFEVSGQIFDDIDAFIDENYVTDQIDEEYGGADVFEAISEPADSHAATPTDEPPRRRFGASLFMGRSEKASAPMMSMAAIPSTPAHTLDEAVSHISDTWQESLLHLIDAKGYTDVDVYKRANVDRKLFSKIRSNTNYQPRKITAVAFALALELNLDETRDMLARAGYALSPSSKFDLIIEYFIDHEVYDTYTINLALFEHGQPLLGE